LPENVGAVAVVLVGEHDLDVSLRSLERQRGMKWIAGALPADERGEFDPTLLREFLEQEAQECALVVLALCGIEFQAHAVARLAAAFHAHPGAVAVYGDLARKDQAGRRWPIAFSAFDYERMLEQGYCAHLFALTRTALDDALSAEPSTLYRVFNAVIDGPDIGRERVVHLPGELGALPALDVKASASLLRAATCAHLRQRGIQADVIAGEGALFPAVRVLRRAEKATTSIVIPSRNRLDLLQGCLETIRPAAARASAEIIVVDNDSSDPEMVRFLRSIDGRSARVLRVPGVFNFARLNNAAARFARRDHLCLLNNDVRAIDDSWLAELLGRIVEPDVGAVGALLSWPSGIVQHGGVVLGPNLLAAHAFRERMAGDPGYADLLRVARECSAVTAACLLTRRADYLLVGGMDEVLFPINFNDVDYCLKLRARGKRVVFTPHANLLHLESATRSAATDRAAPLEREIQHLRARWLDALLNDPFYSPILSLDGIPLSALAWPPRSFAPRRSDWPVPFDIPHGV
jgi:GT2 family glycosyltransferase